MEQLLSILKEFWPQTVTAVSVGLMAIFHKKLVGWISTIGSHIMIRLKKKLKLKVTCPVPGIQSALNEIRAELRPNGGSSLRDAINKIDKRTRNMEIAITTLQVSHEALTEVVDVPFFRAGPTGQTVYCSSALCRLAGMSSSKEYMGANWLTFVHPDDLKMVKEGWESAIHDGRIYLGNFRIQNPYNGKSYHIHEKATPVRDLDGTILGWEGVIMSYAEV